jgi:peptidoglycan/LPS O-acetylase OafA/YrhL
MLYLFRDATHYTDVLYLPTAQRYYAELLFIPVIVLVAWALYRFFEEPVRKLMRRMLHVQFTRTPGPVPAPASDVRQDELDGSSPRA